MGAFLCGHKSMKQTYIKKYWQDEGILFFLHFQDEMAIRQIETSALGKKLLTLNNPIDGESVLYDQNLKDLDLREEDFITQEEFEAEWNRKDNL